MFEDKEFIIFGYHATCHDWIGRAGERIALDKSLATVEQVRQYKAAGFNVMFLTYAFDFNGLKTDFATSKIKEVMDIAYEEGMKCFLAEENMRLLTSKNHSLIDPEKADGVEYFASEEELEAHIRRCLKGAIDHPAFMGVSTRDEPFYPMFEAYGQVYKLLKKIKPDMFIMANLLPYSEGLVTREHRGFYAPNEEEIGPWKGYLSYIEKFYQESNPDFIQYDDYPIHENDAGEKYLIDGHLQNARLISAYCRERNIAFSKVFQTCAFCTTGKLCRKPDEDDMYWQMNIGMAMGVRIYSYWSYFPVINQPARERYDETACFVDTQGNPNPIYYSMQKIHGEMQKAAKVLLDFEFDGCKVFTTKEIPGDSNFIQEYFKSIALGDLPEDTLERVNAVELEKDGAVLITQMKDANGRFGYYIVNITDPSLKLGQSVSVQFKASNRLEVYDRGEYAETCLQNGIAAFELACGRGVFVIPIQK